MMHMTFVGSAFFAENLFECFYSTFFPTTGIPNFITLHQWNYKSVQRFNHGTEIKQKRANASEHAALSLHSTTSERSFQELCSIKQCKTLIFTERLLVTCPNGHSLQHADPKIRIDLHLCAIRSPPLPRLYTPKILYWTKKRQITSRA